MRYLALLLVCILSLISADVFAQATCEPIGDDPPSAGPDDGLRGGGTCDWSVAKAHITATESGGDYTRLGPQHSTMGYACGKYQFMETTIDGYIRSAPHCNGGHCDDPTHSACPTWRSEPCFCVQECFMDAMLADNLERIRNDPACQRLLAGERSINGCSGQRQTLSCEVTESGLLAAFHLGGTDECRKILANGCGDSDSTGTSTGFYTCKHGGLPVPGDCDPADYGITDTGERPPTATYEQYIFMIESGDLPNTGFTILGSWVRALAQMTEQMTTTMIQQVKIIGGFFDAKHQLETQRIMQQKYAEAHKDYHPSEQMCEIGTFVKNLAHTEERAVLTHTAMARSMLDRALATGDSQTAYIGTDEDTRIQAYIDKFCDITDNAQQNRILCGSSGDAEQQNADINFTQTIDAPLTLEVDMLDTGPATKDEENLFAFLDYIFMHDSFPRVSKTKELRGGPYQDMRSLVAMRSVAQDSFAYIISEKTQSPDGPENVGPYMQSLLQEMGVNEDEIRERLGDNPSYYAQMEMLTKLIYQDPKFMANLYDKPANVKRIRAALTAIKLMQDRDIHKALMRREMLVSMLLELRLRKQQAEISKSVDYVNSNPAGLIDQEGQIIQMGP